jgi:hypothetical protein
LGQPVCIPHRCVLYVNYFTNLLSTAHLFSLFGQDCFEPYEGLLHYFE